MVINYLERLFVTSDAGTIIRESDVHHPAAKMIAQAAKMQESEAGDGTNFVISFAGELLGQAVSLIQMGLHPSEILIGYEKAGNEALRLVETLACHKAENLREEAEMTRCIKSAIASKQFGLEDFLSNLIAKAAIYALPVNAKRFSCENVRVTKILGGCIEDSEVIHGMLCVRGSETTHKSCVNAKVVVFNTNIEMQQGETKGTVLLHNADELLSYTQGEEDKFEEFVVGLAEAGVNVVICTGSMSELAIHFFEKYKIVALKIMSKWEIKRLARAVGATPVVHLKTPMPEEMGFADEVSFKEISSKWCTVFRVEQSEKKMSTIVLRGSTNALLEDVERAIDDGVNTVKTLVKDPRMLAGAGATEIYLANHLTDFAKTQPGLDQYAMERFAQSFEVIPRTLAENAGLKPEAIIAEMYSKASTSSTWGVDVNDGTVKDANVAEIWDALDTKTWGMKLTLDVVLTILKIDQIIMSKPAGGPNMANKPLPNPDDM